MWLPEKSTVDDQRQFRQEINMLQSVGRHPHIVSVIGYCTRVGRLRLVVEYCAQGDLLNFLRKVMSYDTWNLPVNFGKFLDFFILRHSATVHNNTGGYSKTGILSSWVFVKSPGILPTRICECLFFNVFWQLNPSWKGPILPITTTWRAQIVKTLDVTWNNSFRDMKSCIE